MVSHFLAGVKNLDCRALPLLMEMVSHLVYEFDTNNKRWALSHCRAVETAYPIKYFIGELKQFIRSTENSDHWFSLRRWSRLM